MIIEMTTAALISYAPVATPGASDVAQIVAKRNAEGRRSLQDSFYLGFRGTELFNELYTVAEGCRKPNWDGQGAAAVSEESYRSAYRFLEALPLGTLPPSVGVEPDGEMTLEWYHSSRRIVSISFSKAGELHYAALLGASKAYGTEPFFGEVPKVIVDLISRVMNA